jgi:hypothetical protein
VIAWCALAASDRPRTIERATRQPSRKSFPSKDYWRLAAIFGVIFFVALLVIGLPWLAILG